jgi:16S rRNA processing protein RimM
LKIYPLTDDINRFKELEHVYIKQNDDYSKYIVNSVRFNQAFVLMYLAEIGNMNEAEKMKTLYLELPETELKQLPEGHYYIYQLIGLNVYEGDRLLGQVSEIIKTGSNDVYIVERGDKVKPLLIPALKDVVKSINLKMGIIKVELPLGLEE